MARERQRFPSKPKRKKLNALPFPRIVLTILSRDRVHGRWVINDRFLRSAIFGGRFRIKHLEKIAAANAARDHAIYRRRRQRRRFRLLLLAVGPDRRAISFGEDGAGRGRDEAKDEQAGFHNDGTPLQSGRLWKSK